MFIQTDNNNPNLSQKADYLIAENPSLNFKSNWIVLSGFERTVY